MLEFLRIETILLFQKYSLHRWIVFVMDNLLVFMTFLLGYLLRFNFGLSGFDLILAINQVFITVSIYITNALVFRSYAGLICNKTIIDIFAAFIVSSISLMVILGLIIQGRKIGR